jgi:hypothetical protein
MTSIAQKTDKRSIVLYVSSAGRDGWSGLLPEPSADGADGPVATLERARDLVRQMKRKGRVRGPVKVLVRGGTYFLAETLKFEPMDSGTDRYPIVYAAYPGEHAVVSGGRRITGWTVGRHRGRTCWTAEIPEVAKGRWNFTQLFVNGTRCSRSRLPKNGYYRFTGLAGLSGSGNNWHKGPDRANFAPGHIKRWKNLDDVEIVTYQLWFDTHHRIKRLDETKRAAYFWAPSLGSLWDEKNKFARYFVENVFEALDTPGEWYLDRPAGRLYYLPRDGENPESDSRGGCPATRRGASAWSTSTFDMRNGYCRRTTPARSRLPSWYPGRSSWTGRRNACCTVAPSHGSASTPWNCFAGARATGSSPVPCTTSEQAE